MKLHFQGINRVTPERIGRYTIREEIGSGGMGTVYQGYDPESGQVAAVKMLPPSMSREPGFLARFEREIAALSKVSSPYIVTLYDHGYDEHLETAWYAMEFVDGETLTARLEREKRLDWREAIALAVEICAALKTAHNAGVIHRDLKPSNLLITRDGHIKLTDFGVAQVFAGGKLTVTGGIIGTVEYMSPEQAQGQRATKQSDIYSLGAVLYAMVTGRPPFTGKTHLEIAHKHRFGQFDSPRLVVPEIPRWLDEVICQCLEKKPEKRYPDAYVLSLRLKEIPKKVELSEAQGKAPTDGSADLEETLAENSEESPAARAKVFGGTLMRDLVRSEVESSVPGSPVQRALDNTWVLVALFLAVVGGGAWLFVHRTPDEQALFLEAQELMKSDERKDWLTAAGILDKLEQNNPEQWKEPVRQYRKKIAAAELEQDFKRAAQRRNPQVKLPDGPLIFIRRAIAELEEGHQDQSRKTLWAARTLYAGDDRFSEELDLIDDLLDRLEKNSRSSKFDMEKVRRSLQQARELSQQGNSEQALALCSAILWLYRDHPSDEVQSIVREAEVLMRQANDH